MQPKETKEHHVKRRRPDFNRDVLEWCFKTKKTQDGTNAKHDLDKKRTLVGFLKGRFEKRRAGLILERVMKRRKRRNDFEGFLLLLHLC